ncbi:hypothetical protein PENSPDRAFT_687307 [Peniophora sp. CONT]|nr:hypothetical protein PENSPDRAFT_687307 [Peniophora sp. CONT]
MAPYNPDYIVLLNNALSKKHMAHRLTWDFTQEGPLHKAVHTAVAKGASRLSHTAPISLPIYYHTLVAALTGEKSDADAEVSG